MIPRILVPRNIRLPGADSASAPARRHSTFLDSRTLVPAELPAGTLDTRSNIPSHVPLDVLTKKLLIPRDMPLTPLQSQTEIPDYVPLTVLDARTVVPRDAEPLLLEVHVSPPPEEMRELIEPDVLSTGDVNLLSQPKRDYSVLLARLGASGSFLFHAALITFILLTPKLFPYRPPTQEELDLARRQLGYIYLPPRVEDVPRVERPNERQSPQMKVDPRVLRQVAPPNVQPDALPGPEVPRAPVVRDYPSAPTPQNNPGDDGPRSTPRRNTGPQIAQLENPNMAPKSDVPTGLQLPRTSPGRALEDSARESIKGAGQGTGSFGGPIPPAPGGGGGQGYLGGNVEMLTPTEGVDFSNYLARVLASVKRNWLSLIPQSAKFERGRVALQFRILRDGNVPYPEPNLLLGSGRDPLDRAAMSSIRTSSPFEPLPPAFRGPYIELRFIFLYNLPLDYR